MITLTTRARNLLLNIEYEKDANFSRSDSWQPDPQSVSKLRRSDIKRYAIGKKTITNIADWLENFGLTLADPPDNRPRCQHCGQIVRLSTSGVRAEQERD